jgi:Tfp pilus assembly PilM family ATPase
VKARRLPLGVDMGTSRIRVAYAERDGAGKVHLVAVAARDVEEGCDGDVLAAVLEELGKEVAPGCKRAVIAVPPSEAAIKVVRFPKMGWSERRRAAAFEAERFAGWDTKNVRTLVRVHAVNRVECLHAIGAVREPAIAARVRILKRAGFRPAGIDHTAYALRRAFPHADAVLDVGMHQSILYGFCAHGPIVQQLAGGGERVTQAIGKALSIDRALSERRKRILGTAGAGEEARTELGTRASQAVAKLREAMPVRRIALVGNGARLFGLAADIEATTEALVELPVSDLLREGSYPEDVVRAAAPDWALAASLATWAIAT